MFQIPKRFLESWKASVAEAEAILAGQPEKATSEFDVSNESLRNSSTTNDEYKVSTTPPCQSPSSSINLGDKELHPNQPLRTKDAIFANNTHSVQKDPCPNNRIVIKNQLTSLKKNPTNENPNDIGDNPYSDIDSVPRILCPKANERPSKPQTTLLVVKKEEKVQGERAGHWFSRPGKGHALGSASRPGLKLVRSSFVKAACRKKPVEGSSTKWRENKTPGLEYLSEESIQALKGPLKCLPASSRLMIKALKALEEDKAISASLSDQHVSPLPRESESEKLSSKLIPEEKPTAELEYKSQNSTSLAAHIGQIEPETPVEHTEATIKSEDEASLAASKTVAISSPLNSMKTEREVSELKELPNASPKPLVLTVDDLEDMKEVTLKSFTDEDNGQPVSFQTDTNYKFSTFLMLLKDMHDTRELQGRPLRLEPDSQNALIKEEPSLLPEEDFLTWLGQASQASGKSCPKSKVLPSKSKQTKTKRKSGYRQKVDKQQHSQTNSLNVPAHGKYSYTTVNLRGPKSGLLGSKKDPGFVNVPFECASEGVPLDEPRKDQSLLAEDATGVHILDSAPKKRWQKFEQDNREADTSGQEKERPQNTHVQGGGVSVQKNNLVQDRVSNLNDGTSLSHTTITEGKEII